jgi:hypothetical protein
MQGGPEDVLAHSAAADKQVIASEVPFRQVICDCPVDLLKTSALGHNQTSRDVCVTSALPR